MQNIKQVQIAESQEDWDFIIFISFTNIIVPIVPYKEIY